MRNHALSSSRPGEGRFDTKARTLLEAAGQVFAEKGFDRATAKEICARAGVNAASVNYYFGGIEGLYTAVLEEAYGQIPRHQALSDAIAGKANPEARLRALIELMVRTLTGPAASSWTFRVISREFLAPSPATESLRRKQIEPKGRIISSIVSEVMGLSEDHPAVALGWISVMAPCVMLLVKDRRSLKSILPKLELGPDGADALVDHLLRHAMAGLTAVGKEIRKKAQQARSA